MATSICSSIFPFSLKTSNQVSVVLCSVGLRNTCTLEKSLENYFWLAQNSVFFLEKWKAIEISWFPYPRPQFFFFLSRSSC